MEGRRWGRGGLRRGETGLGAWGQAERERERGGGAGAGGGGRGGEGIASRPTYEAGTESSSALSSLSGE